MDFIEHINQLPPDPRSFFQSDEIRLNIRRSLLAFRILEEEKISIVSDIVAKIFVSKIDLMSLNLELEKNTGLSKEIAAGLSLELIKRIFKPFPEVFKNVDAVEASLLPLAPKPGVTEGQITQNLFQIEPWLSKKSEETVLKGRGEKGVLVSNGVDLSKKAKNSKLPLLKAITEYPRLSDQLITEEKMKLKGQPEPQRPNLGNWIRYYRAELGIGFHNQVERGRFLFQSENGKRLTNEERERINLVIKSIEEDFPIDIDTEGSVVVFPARHESARPAAAPVAKPLFPPRSAAPSDRPLKPFQPSVPTVPPRAEEAPIPPSRPSFLSSAFRPAKNVAGETLHFSTGHVLPGEKAASEPTPPAAPPTMAAPAQPFRPAGIRENRTTTLPRSPYSIRPLRLRNEREADEQ